MIVPDRDRAERPRPPQPPRVADRLPPPAPGALDPAGIARDLVLTEVAIDDHDLTGVDSEYAELFGSRFSGVGFGGSQWRHASITDCSFVRCDLANADFAECGWRRVVVSGSRLTGAGLSTCTIRDVTLADCVIDLGRFRFAELERVRFTGCRLTGSDWTNATLTDVGFADCDLTESDFSHTRMDGVRFERSELLRLTGIAGLAGATVGSQDLLQIAESLAQALRIRIED